MIRVDTRSLVTALLLLGGVARAEENLCGARCVHRALEALGKRDDLTDVIQALYDSPAGGVVSLADLSRVLKQSGVSSRMLALSQFDIPRSPYPIILHVDGNHFIVLERCDGITAVVWDGLMGSREVSWWWLRPRCSNAALACMPEGEEGVARADPTARYVAMTAGPVLVLIALWLGWRLVRRKAGPSAPAGAAVVSGGGSTNPGED